MQKPKMKSMKRVLYHLIRRVIERVIKKIKETIIDQKITARRSNRMDSIISQKVVRTQIEVKEDNTMTREMISTLILTETVVKNMGRNTIRVMLARISQEIA